MRHLRAPLAALVALACTEARTEIVVTVRATAPPAALRVTVRDEGPGGVLRFEETRPVGAAAGAWALPLSFGLLPSDVSSPGLAWVEAVACEAPGRCAGGVTQRARLAYRRGQTLAYDLWLSPACDANALRCSDGQRCAGGACVGVDDEPRPVGGDAAPPREGDGGDAGDVNAGDAADDSADVTDAADDGHGGDVSDAAADVGLDAGPDGAGDGGADAEVSLAQRSCEAGMRGCGMAEVPGGTFTLGAPRACVRDDAGADAAPDALGPYLDDGECVIGGAPEVREVTVSPFALDRYEVTVARFRAFWDAGPSARAALFGAVVRYPGGRSIRLNGREAREPNHPAAQPYTYDWTTERNPARDEHPVQGVDWWTAMAFCAWDGGRLPTEAEWEFAARWWAVDGLAPGRLHAIGDDVPLHCGFAAVRASFGACGGEDGSATFRVGHFPTRGPVFDLTGSLSEWVADEWAPYGTAPCWNASPVTNPLCARMDYGVATPPRRSRVTRGGWWSEAPGPLHRTASRAFEDDDYAGQYRLGIRCARSL